VRDRTEAAFTLIELVVAVSLLTVVMGALAGVYIILLRLAPAPGSAYSESHDAQVASTFWPTDVQSAEDVSTTDTSCSDPALGATAPLVRFAWTTPGGLTKLAAYRVRAGVRGAPGEDLIRTFCTQDGGKPVVRTSTVIAHRAEPASVLCDTPSCAPPVRTSKLTVTEADGYTFTVGGTRRVAP